MIHILLSLSVGWTLGSQTSNNTQQVMINISIAVVEVNEKLDKNFTISQ